MAIALLIMQLISRAIGPWLLFTDYLSLLLMRELLDFTGPFNDFLFSGNTRFRISLFLMVLFLAVGAGLGNWASKATDQLTQCVLQAAAVVMMITTTLIYLADRQTLEYFLQDILLTLAIAFLAYAVILYKLLELNTNDTRWRIALGIAVIGIVIVLRDAAMR